MIADRTAYDVLSVYWQTIKLRDSKHDLIQRIYERTQTLSTQAWQIKV